MVVAAAVEGRAPSWALLAGAELWSVPNQMPRAAAPRINTEALTIRRRRACN
jgi:hypothetical protein